ncbi:MAG TPA: DUF1428 domain-containing protein [Gammaproteobacteria bacterium]
MIFGGFAPLTDYGRRSGPGYVDGFVIPVPAASKDACRELATQHAELLQEFGATRVVDAGGDDVPNDKTIDYKGAVKANGDETVVFSWTVVTGSDAVERKVVTELAGLDHRERQARGVDTRDSEDEV